MDPVLGGVSESWNNWRTCVRNNNGAVSKEVLLNPADNHLSPFRSRTDNSVYVTTSVFLPSFEDATPEDLKSVQRAARRSDNSMVLTVAAETINFGHDKTLASFDPVWARAEKQLALAPFTPAGLIERRALLNVRMALWPEQDELHLALSRQTIQRLAAWNADTYISVSRSEPEDTDVRSDVPCSIGIHLSTTDSLTRSSAAPATKEAGPIIELDARARQIQFEKAVDEVLFESLDSHDQREGSCAVRDRAVISFSAGNLGSGIVLTNQITERLANRHIYVLLCSI